MIPMSRENTTLDSLFGGQLKILQPIRGYRFAVDAVLLAGFCTPAPTDVVVDLGTGCGVIPLILAYRQKGKRIFGIEIQENLDTLAKKNVEINEMESKVEIIHGDFKQIDRYFSPECADLVVSNPPYRKLNTGRINPGKELALARHEILATLDDVLGASRYLLKTRGRLGLIYPAFRLGYLFSRAIEKGFQPKKLKIVYSSPGQTARLVYVEAVKGGGEELHVDPPFFIYQDNGEYSPEMNRLYSGEKSGPGS